MDLTQSQFQVALQVALQLMAESAAADAAADADADAEHEAMNMDPLPDDGRYPPRTAPFECFFFRHASDFGIEDLLGGGRETPLHDAMRFCVCKIKEEDTIEDIKETILNAYDSGELAWSDQSYITEKDGLWAHDERRARPTIEMYENAVARLLERGADANQTDRCGRTPLHAALMHVRAWGTRIAALLLDHGADASFASNGGDTALHMAVARDVAHPGIAKLLLDHGANIDAASNNDDHPGATPLLVALKNEVDDVAALLLSRGANVNVADDEGTSPLMISVRCRELCTTVLDCGANTETRNKRGKSALNYAVERGTVGVVGLLLDRGADINQTTGPDAMNLLMVAVGRHRLAVVQLLLERGIRVGHETHDGASAFDTLNALPRARRGAIRSVLRAHGARPGSAARTAALQRLVDAIPEVFAWYNTDDFFTVAPLGGTGLPVALKRKLLRKFGAHLRTAHDGAAVQPLAIPARRDNVLEGLCGRMNDPAGLRGLDVRFEGEVGTGDGLRREWYRLVHDELCGLKHGLFGSRDGNNTVEPNPHSGMIHPDHLVHFELLGKVVMVALRNGEQIDGLSLSLPFRKLVLGRELAAAEDLPAIVGADIYRNRIAKVRDQDISRWGLYFTAPLLPWPGDDGTDGGDIMGYKRKRQPELCEGGADKEVTQENKAEYLRLLQEALLRQYEDGIAAQTAAFRQGLAHQCGDAHVFRLFCRLVTPADFDLLVGGVAELDVGAWQQHAVVQPAAAAEAAVVQWFWDIVRNELDAEQRSQLLAFATGCGRAPVGGFEHMSGYNGVEQPFTLHVLPHDPRDAMMKARTCFNTIDVQMYPTRAELLEKVLIACAHHEGFNEHAVADAH